MANYKKLGQPVRLGPLSVAKVMKALSAGPCSIDDLQSVSGLSRATLNEYTRALRKEHILYVSDWGLDKRGCKNVKIFTFGFGTDVPKVKKSKAQIARECRQRKREQKFLIQSANVDKPALPAIQPAVHAKSFPLQWPAAA